jgi:hypothetical protein
LLEKIDGEEDIRDAGIKLENIKKKGYTQDLRKNCYYA